MSARDVVLDFFARNAKNPLPANPDEILGSYYLDAGIIDSLGIVLMVSELEEKLGVSLSSEDMQSYEFQTIGGLIGILDRLTARAK